jgi:hypothetical protein
MIFPCFEAMIALMKKNEQVSYFVPGEEELVAMTTQLKRPDFKVNKRKIYKADGVVRIDEFDDLEVLVLETAGPFGNDDHAKISFDNSKEMFALLAVLKKITDIYKYASVDEFRKLKLYLVQSSGKDI